MCGVLASIFCHRTFCCFTGPVEEEEAEEDERREEG